MWKILTRASLSNTTTYKERNRSFFVCATNRERPERFQVIVTNLQTFCLQCKQKNIPNMVKVGEGWKRTETKDEDQGGINCYLVYAKEKKVTNCKKGREGTSGTPRDTLKYITHFCREERKKKKVLKSYSLENQSFFQMLQGNIIRS